MSVASGDTVELLATKRSFERHPATVIAVSQTALAVCLERAVAWIPGEDVYILTQTTSGRLVSVAEFERNSGEVAIFRVLAPWKVYNRRLHRRYAANAKVVLLADGEPDTEGNIVDISLSGARVAVGTVPETPATTVRIGMGGSSSEIPCMVRGTVIEGDEVYVRLRFTNLTPEHVESLQRFLTLLDGLDRQDPWSFTA